jgi:hypothetical protein
LTGAGTDGFGFDVDGSGDFGRPDRTFAADGMSDLIVGGINGTHAYVYFGTPNGYLASPSITITGTLAGFGQAVVNAGDLDGDGLSDIAIASANEGGGRLYVFSRKNPPASWGTTTSWPATLTSAQANYVLSIDQTFAGGMNGILPGGLARLGNFDGTGSDDVAIGIVLHNSQVGGLLIVKGSASFSSGTIPDAARAIQVDGTTAGGFFGSQTIGIGQFFPAPAGPTLITSAPGAIYAFRGQAPTGTLSASAADDSVVGPAADFYGYNLGLLGPLGGSSAAVTVSGPTAPAPYVDVHFGTAASGPLLGPAGGLPAPSIHLTNRLSGNSFGIVNIGGGVRGTSQVVSFIGGDAVADLVVAGQGEAGVPLYIVNGAALPSLGAAIDVSTALTAVVPPIVKVENRLPSAWGGYAGTSMIVDANLDGYGDFVIGELAPAKAGRAVVFY